MWRIGKTRPKELWEEEVQSPLGDIEAAEIIRAICRSAADSAARVGSPSDGAKQESWDTTNQHARYRGAARRAMEIAMKISDELMRDAAVGEIVDLCLKDLFQGMSGLLHGIFGGVTSRCVRFATARAYSCQTSWGASST